jgi:hypothetical protein
MSACVGRRRVLAAALLLGGLAGCGGGPKLVPVKGRVIYGDGRPVSAASVVFTPDESKGNTGLLATGLLGLDGSFTLRTYPHGDGAMVGAYKVTISLGRAPRELAKYGLLKQTPFRIEVPAEGLKDLELKLK